jgi:hypothetical protein
VKLLVRRIDLSNRPSTRSFTHSGAATPHSLQPARQVGKRLTGRQTNFVPTEELGRRQGVKPITSVDDLAAEVDPFESDEEYEAFVAHLCAS